MKHHTYLKAFAKYSLLNVLGMAGLSCYILADTFFISKGLGAGGLAALNLAIPVYSFIHGCGLMLGMGGATRFSICKGQENRPAGNRAFTHSLGIGVGFAVFFLFCGIFLSDWITCLLGADDDVFFMCRTYLQVILLFSPMFLLNNILLCFVRNDGAPQFSMAAMLAGSFSNIILDYIFIFRFHMGIFGAVLATGLAPVISMAVLSPYFIRKKNSFGIRTCAISFQIIKSILLNGIPSLITEVSSGIVIIIFNFIIWRLCGNTGIAAYGIIANLSLVVLSIFTGIAQGMQPLLSQSCGTGSRRACKAILHYGLISVAALSAVIYLCIYLGGEQITAVFNTESNALLQSLAVPGLRLYFTASFFAGLNIILCVYFTSIDQARPAHIISLLRGIIIIVPMAFLLSLGGILGVWCAFPVTELLVSGIGCFLLWHSGRSFDPR